MSDFYFVVSALPFLVVGEPPEMPFGEFLDLLALNLAPEEMESVRVLQRLVDLYNLAALWRGEPLDPHGSLSHHDLEEAVSSVTGLPGYMHDFIAEHDSSAARLKSFGKLASLFFQEEMGRAQGFLLRYLGFERSLRLVLLGFRAKVEKRDVKRELQYEDPSDDLVAQIVAQGDAPTYEPPDDFGALRPLFTENRSDPRRLFLALNAYRFREAQAMRGDDIFSIDYVLSYMVRLMIVEKSQELESAYE